MNTLKERLQEALDNKRTNKMNTYVWKGKKEVVNGEVTQTKVKLVDASDEQLKQFYQYCHTMLYNTDKKDPGRYNVLDLINSQITNCKVELFLRSLETAEHRIPRYTLYEQLTKQLKEANVDPKTLTLAQVSDNCPIEFEDLNVDLVLKGCLDALGRYGKRHLSLNFILKQGIWFTKKDEADLKEYDSNGNQKELTQVVKERLDLRPDTELKVTPKGLTYNAMRSLVTLKDTKYSEMTTDQLNILRTHILLKLRKEVEMHIEQWEHRMKQIKEVAETRGLTL